jgi:hypothetical protein
VHHASCDLEQDVGFAGFNAPEPSRTSPISMAIQPRPDGRLQCEAIEASNNYRDFKLGELETRLGEIWSRFGILVSKLQRVASKMRKGTGSVSKWRRSKTTQSSELLDAVVLDYSLPTDTDSARSPENQAPKKEAAWLFSKRPTSEPTMEGAKPDQAWVQSIVTFTIAVGCAVVSHVSFNQLISSIKKARNPVKNGIWTEGPQVCISW